MSTQLDVTGTTACKASVETFSQPSPAVGIAVVMSDAEYVRMARAVMKFICDQGMRPYQVVDGVYRFAGLRDEDLIKELVKRMKAPV
jgi:hypothetical protein